MSVGDFPLRQNSDNTQLTTGIGLTISSSWGAGQQLELNLPMDPNFKRLIDRVMELEKRLLVLHPNEALHEKYPALKEAYDAYLMIERLINGKTE
jgi:hypothetical protein